MKKLLRRVILNSVSLRVIDYFSESISFRDGLSVILTALALAVLNSTVKPFLKVVSLPITILTAGLFSLVINGAVLYLAFYLNSGSSISSFGSAIWVSIILTVLNSLLESILQDK